MAKEVGKGLGECEVLLREVQGGELVSTSNLACANIQI
jgi:hypothetical protein